MDSLFFSLMLVLAMYLVINWIIQTFKDLMTKPNMDQIKIPNDMKISTNIRRKGFKGFKGTLEVNYTPKIKRVHEIHASTEEEFERKVQEIIGKYKI